MFNTDQHHINSSLRENIVEHLFVGAALRLLWQNGVVNVEILRSEFDAYGYDLVITAGQLVRHIQLKAGTKLKPISVSRLLAEKLSGCIVYIEVNDRLDLGPYYVFSSDAGERLPDISKFKTTRRATANSNGDKPLRAGHVDVPTSKFEIYQTLAELLSYLLSMELQPPCQTIPLTRLGQRKPPSRSIARKRKSALRRLPILTSDDEAERFLETEDLSEYDLSNFQPFTFLFEKSR
ncbi:Hypothetical protein NGAL_HAMBI2610_43950 [Neorhizobium galegae bv. orientalis]|nr:Hypothetical protein NGAL_HAMBI2610_43950 [Neorhizobium galegae bv. orientalis]